MNRECAAFGHRSWKSKPVFLEEPDRTAGGRLGRESRSTWGWKQNALITIDEESARAIYNPDYHAARLISGSIPEGARRIFAMGADRSAAAFRKGGMLYVLFPHLADSAAEASIQIGGQTVRCAVSPCSINVAGIREEDGKYICVEELRNEKHS